MPDEVVAAAGRQLGFWGGTAGADERAVRAVARVAGLLGLEAVVVPERRGGRGRRPSRSRWSRPPPSTSARSAVGSAVAAPTGAGRPPWPGRLPAPAPAASPTDAGRRRGGRRRRRAGAASPAGALATGDAGPAAVGGGRWVDVVAWAGPWPVEERWWDPAADRRRARLQVVDADGVARLLALEGGRWWRRGRLRLSD